MNKLSCIFNLMTILYVLFTEKVLNVEHYSYSFCNQGVSLLSV